MAAKLNLMEDEWTQQPPPSVRCGINRQNQFGAKVDCYYLASELRNGHPRVTGPSGLASDFQSQIVVGNAPCTASRPFTVVVVMAFPQANIAAQAQVYVGSGNGFRLDTNTTEGGMYGLWTANGVANSAMPTLDASGQFDMRKIVLVSDWTPSGISSWWRRDGFSAQSFSETIGYAAPTDTRLLLGLNPNGAAKFYGVYILRGNVGEAGARKLIENPWQIFEPEQIPLFKPTVTAQYARPISDVSAGGWTASTGSDLFAMLDETSANDSDYITSTTASTCEVALGSLSDPALSTGHIVRYRISATGGGIIVRLRQGTTTIATWTHDPAPASLTTYSQTLSSGEADSITDYANLRYQFEAVT